MAPARQQLSAFPRLGAAGQAESASSSPSLRGTYLTSFAHNRRSEKRFGMCA